MEELITEIDENIAFVKTNGKNFALLLTNIDRKTLVTFPDGREFELQSWYSEGENQFMILKNYPEKLEVVK